MIVPPVIATLLAACVAMVPSPSVVRCAAASASLPEPARRREGRQRSRAEPVKYGRRSAAEVR